MPKTHVWQGPASSGSIVDSDRHGSSSLSIKVRSWNWGWGQGNKCHQQTWKLLWFESGNVPNKPQLQFWKQSCHFDIFVDILVACSECRNWWPHVCFNIASSNCGFQRSSRSEFESNIKFFSIILTVILLVIQRTPTSVNLKVKYNSFINVSK